MKKIQFELTGKCPLKCEFCYNGSNLGIWGKIPFDKVLERAGEGNLIFLGGGEPTIYPGIERLISELIKKSNFVCISTSGFAYKELPENKNLLLQISVPTIHRALYKEITGRDNLETLLINIQRYKKKHNVLINSVIYRKNEAELVPLAKYCHEQNIALVVSAAIKVRSIETISHAELQRKCLPFILTGYNIRVPKKSWEGMEYYTPDKK